MNLFLVSLLLTLTDFTHCSVVRIVYVEQVKPSWIYQSDKKKNECWGFAGLLGGNFTYTYFKAH